MKKLLFVLALIMPLIAFTGCKQSIESKTNKAFDEVTEFLTKFPSGYEMSIIDKEFIYAAPNDSLAILEFTCKIKGEGSVSMYFGYVVSDKGEDDDYWIVSFENPVASAKDFQNSLSSVIGEADNKDDKNNDDMLYSTIRLNCSASYTGGKGKSMKETREIIGKVKR